MGMQCHFSLSDVMHAGLKVTIVKEAHVEGYPNAWVARIGELFAVSMVDSNSFDVWADCGGWSGSQQKMIEVLIKHRIPFNCS